MTMALRQTRQPSAGYQLFILTLSLFALASLAIRTVTRVDAQAQAILDYADTAVCAVFLADFVASLVRAENRWRYLVRWGWLDLLSSIPTIDALRWGRAARVLRAFRLLRGLRATRILAAVVVRRRAENTALAVGLTAMLLVISSSIAVLHLETAPGSNIKTAEDALWWAFATITTVGYGDRFPVTTEGRMVAAVLMCAGVGLFGTFSGLLAAWFLAPTADKDGVGDRTPAEFERLREENRRLREQLAGKAADA